MSRLEGRWTFGEHRDEVTVILDAEVDVGGLGAWMKRVAGRFADHHLQKVKTAFPARIAAMAGWAARGVARGSVDGMKPAGLPA